MSNNLNTRIWPSEGMNYNYPELQLPEIQQKAPIALCFSGGGTRAMSAAMGQLRALNEMGVLSKIRYISCVSGGSWASTIYTYYKGGALNDNDLLGHVTEVGDITEEHLQNSLKRSNLAYVANNGLIKDIMGWILEAPFYEYHLSDCWIFGVGQSYLEYFGLFNTKNAESDENQFRYFSYDDKTVEEIISCNPQLNKNHFLTVNKDRPFLVVNSCILPETNASSADMLSFEYTPLTVGRPFLYQSSDSGLKYGGGFIEPFAFRSYPPQGGIKPSCKATDNEASKEPGWKTAFKKLFALILGEPYPAKESEQPQVTPRQLGSKGWVEVSNQDRPQSIADATGTSSSAFAQWYANHLGNIGSLDPEAIYWPIDDNTTSNSTSKADTAMPNTLFGDGGLVDNYGLISVIQRGIKSAIVFINTTEKLDVNYKPNIIEDPTGHCDQSLPALFGYSNPKWQYTYPNNQVFPFDDFEVVLSALQDRKKKGAPLICTTHHKLVKNEIWGIPANDTPIAITWVYLDRSSNWEKGLPRNVASQINEGNAKDPSGPFKHFPNYLTFEQNDPVSIFLTKPQITLLADFCCDVILTDPDKTVQKALQEIK